MYRLALALLAFAITAVILGSISSQAVNQTTPTPTPTVTPTPAPSPSPSPSSSPGEVFVQFSAPTFAAVEGCVPATLTVTLGNGAFDHQLVPNTSTVTVDYAITGGTASQKSDYTYFAGTLIEAVSQPAKNIRGRLVFAPGETSQTIQILINEDAYVEPPETVQVTLSNPQGAVLGSPVTATLTINDNDHETFAPWNPIDEPQNFVCQQYHDFLHRQPDEVGLAFWTNQIKQCGDDRICVEEMRNYVAMAFFLSIENQQTGYFVDRLYEACLHRRPSYEEYMRDMHVVGLGVEIGAPNWQEVLEENKRSFAEEFVRRDDFVARYPTSMSAGQFVDEMFEYADVTPTNAERQQAMDAFGGGEVAGRAAAMRETMESASVFRAYYNRALVLSEYFGFLRRNPNQSPDADWIGFDYWLAKMDSHSRLTEDVTNPVDAFERVKRGEMVRAFLVSREYRERFGKP